MHIHLSNLVGQLVASLIALIAALTSNITSTVAVLCIRMEHTHAIADLTKFTVDAFIVPQILQAPITVVLLQRY